VTRMDGSNGIVDFIKVDDVQTIQGKYQGGSKVLAPKVGSGANYVTKFLERKLSLTTAPSHQSFDKHSFIGDLKLLKTFSRNIDGELDSEVL
jgi:hypothetical protein